MIRSRLTVIVGGLVTVGAVVVPLTGGGWWWTFWLGGVGLALVTVPARRQYWSRVEGEDPASVPLRVMWMCAGLVAGCLFFGITQLLGVVFGQSTLRGVFGLIAALGFATAWSKARDERRRLLRQATGLTDGGSSGVGQR